MPGKTKNYSPEFREEAARLVVETSRPIVDVAREIGVTETSLGNWVRAYRKNHAGDEPPLQISERARLRELERENRELRMKNDFLSKAAAYVCPERQSAGRVGAVCWLAMLCERWRKGPPLSPCRRRQQTTVSCAG